jgi:GNAT superfamily N-acetyltransferase
MTMLVRPRRDADLDACVAILAATRTDGYPIRWPDDPAAWLTPRGFLFAWVVEQDGTVTGHVALRNVTGMDGVPWWTAASGAPADGIAAISRLFVAPAARRRGCGARLLATASDHAARHGLRPALDVLDTDRTAVALYERAGWTRVASAPVAHAGGEPVMTHYYLAPAPSDPLSA